MTVGVEVGVTLAVGEGGGVAVGVWPVDGGVLGGLVAAGGVKRLAEELLGSDTMTSLEGGLPRDEMR